MSAYKKFIIAIGLLFAGICAFCALVIRKEYWPAVFGLNFLWCLTMICILLFLDYKNSKHTNEEKLLQHNMLIDELRKLENQFIEKFNLYVGSNPEYLSEISHEKRNALIDKTKSVLQNVNNYENLESDVYYMLLYTLFFTATENIWSASIMDDNEWIDTPEEDEYLKVNLNAVKNKIHLKRIFIVSESDVNLKLNIAPIKKFIEMENIYLHLFVVFKEKLPESILRDIGSGFIAFDKFAIACDVFFDKEIRGSIIFDKGNIERYNRIFMTLDNYIEPLNKEFVKKYFCDEGKMAKNAFVVNDKT